MEIFSIPISRGTQRAHFTIGVGTGAVLRYDNNYWMRLSMKPKADADLHNSSYHMKAEFSNCFIIYSKYFQSFKETKFTLLSSVTNC